MTYRITIMGDPATDAETICDAIQDLLGLRESQVCFHCLKRVLSGKCVNDPHSSETSARKQDV